VNKVVKNENIVFIDVDDTLILHTNEFDMKESSHLICVKDPLKGPDIVVEVHGPMVRLLKEEFQRGSFVVVWSRGGYQWASNVVNALKLNKFVHQVMSKPVVYFDDKDIGEWLKYRVYLKPEQTYKNVKLTKNKEKKSGV
jgi:predicted phosphatase